MANYLPSERSSDVKRVVLFVALLLFVLVGACSSATFVKTGHVGVQTIFGRVTGNVLSEGIHFVNPLSSVNDISIRTQEIKEHAEVPSSEGLVFALETSLLFRLTPTKAAQVYQTNGPDYQDVIVFPTFRGAARTITASHAANALYSSAREAVGNQIMEELRKSMEPRGITVEAVLLRDIKLPDKLKDAIEAKQQAEQQAMQMEFVLNKERQEAERKRVEAQGIADFQRIVSQGLSEPLLQWKGIEATERLAQSQNSKVVIIGASKSGLPIILGQ